tara:strand:+ start:669 stop:1433 length:765 start_codon:yes stop_codon:yes gene_type:complete
MLKKIVKALFAISMGSITAVAAFGGVIDTINQIPSTAEFQHPDNIDPALGPPLRHAIQRSRKSVVRILSMTPEGAVASTTGTYIKAKGRYYVVTVMHGLVGPCEATRIWTEADGFTACKEIIISNPAIDYAIIEVDELPSAEAVPIPKKLPRGDEWLQAISNQAQLYYTGYPNSTGPLTFAGRVVGYAEGDFIYMHSFAWSGASGSGVFSPDGKLVGYLLAIDVGETVHGVDVLEDIVVVVPAFKIDWSLILER